jgi:hypothetical protein
MKGKDEKIDEKIAKNTYKPYMNADGIMASYKM